MFGANTNRLISRLAGRFLGMVYFVFGLNGFLNFIPAPETPPPEAVTAFMSGMTSAPYFIPVLKGTEVLGGALLLSGFFAPLALILLAPITIQITLFHAFLTPEIKDQIMPVLMVIAHVTAAAGYWELYRPLFRPRSKV